MKKQLLVYASLWYAFLIAFWYVSGTPFAKPGLQDLEFHLKRSQDPLCSLRGCPYYAPLFHVLLYALNGVFSPQASFIAAECLVVFVLLPWAFYRLSYALWGKREAAEHTVFLVLLGSSYTIITIFAGIIPQALNMAFLALGLEAMIVDIRSPSHGMKWRIALWGILSLLSHQKGWVLYAILVFFWLLIKKLYIPCVGMFVAGIATHPEYTVYPFETVHLPELFLLWLNPINVYLGLKGHRRAERAETLLVDVAILASVLLAWVDPNYRPILTASVLLSVYGGKALMVETEMKSVVLRFALIIMYLAHLLYCIAGISAILLKNCL